MRKVSVSFTVELSDKQSLELLAKREKTTLSGLVSELVISGLKQKIHNAEIQKIQADVNQRLDGIIKHLNNMTEMEKWIKAWGMTQKLQYKKRNKETGEEMDQEFEQNFRSL